ncbi:NlpC/p60-like transpeptidase-domain-containing protein [Echria macrotheca]|uniref:NlpC/p60-like transpeptidase-domain-containing protein n=1 Tax=Echria macrotheca TaxID=438768 RepID=A0AAJ0B3T3_9PEZI|nr:NlpC/p60-like transpeptidase-domain-containing protein [Echria macrotheca]
MERIPYIGSGPYCYANSLAMMLGKDSPSPAVLEFATGSPFGMEIIEAKTPFFDPYGWDPSKGLDNAIRAAGWESNLGIGKDEDDALAKLRSALADGPVFVGPLDMSQLRYHPDSEHLSGADHYIVILRIQDDWVEVHDPHGFPYATLPLRDFMRAWKAEGIQYGKPYMLRTSFRRVDAVSEEEVIRRSLNDARRWLSMKDSGQVEMPPGSVGNGTAATQLARMIETGFNQGLRAHMIYFAVRVGARRLSDGSTCLARVGQTRAADVMAKQARLVGSLQYILVQNDTAAAVKTLGILAETYGELETALGE